MEAQSNVARTTMEASPDNVACTTMEGFASASSSSEESDVDVVGNSEVVEEEVEVQEEETVPVPVPVEDEGPEEDTVPLPTPAPTRRPTPAPTRRPAPAPTRRPVPTRKSARIEALVISDDDELPDDCGSIAGRIGDSIDGLDKKLRGGVSTQKRALTGAEKKYKGLQLLEKKLEAVIARQDTQDQAAVDAHEAIQGEHALQDLTDSQYKEFKKKRSKVAQKRFMQRQRQNKAKRKNKKK